MLSRALWGAGIGAAVGGLTQGNTGGFLGGAIGGAAIGAGSRSIGNWASKKGISAAGLMNKGLTSGIRGSRWARNKLVAGGGGVMTSNRSAIAGGLHGIGPKLGAANRWVNRNRGTINKYGSYGLGALGAGAAASIGSSAFNTNGGY